MQGNRQQTHGNNAGRNHTLTRTFALGALKLGIVAIAFALVLWNVDRSSVAVIDEAKAPLHIVDASPSAGSRATWAEIDPGEYRLSEIAPEPSEAADAELPAEQRVLLVRRGDTLLDLLLSAGIPRAEAHEAISALRAVYNPRDLRPGQEITLTIGPPGLGEQPALLSASIAANAERDINLSRDADGRFTALKRARELRRELVRATAAVRTSLFEAGAGARVPGAIMVELIRAFSYDVDFQRDIQPGDSFEVVFERFRDGDGRLAKDGQILYGALTLSGATKRLYRYTHGDGTHDFYDERGQSVRKALLRTPIDGARLTSGFGTRMHPILGYSAKHKGADFGAPEGTPIQAAGDGVIEMAGWNGAYGQYIRIRHNAEYATAYAHLSRIAPAVRQGDRIRQGQVIGYVGSTGRSTGPHLHYEVIRRGTQINPMSVQLPTGRKLEGEDLIQFRIARAEFELVLAGLEPTTRISRVADSPSGAALP